jgi:hypothetical protein
LPSLEATGAPTGPAIAAEATIAAVIATASPTIKVGRLRIESLLQFGIGETLSRTLNRRASAE